MRSLLATAIILSLAACSGPAPPRPEAAAHQGGWAIAPEGELNQFFDCLDENGVTLIAAHRGGPSSNFPENAIETFEKTLAEAPAILEVDVATSSDGVPYLMHDETLDRTTTGSGPSDALPFKDLRALKLEDPFGRPTAFAPPSFADALSWANGRTILEIDFKRSTRYEDVIAEINRQDAVHRVILIAYTLAQAERLHRLAPEAMISLSLSTQSDLNRTVAAGVPLDRLLGFTGVDDPKPRLFSILESQDVEVIFGTLGGEDSIDGRIEASGDDSAYAAIAALGADIIATDQPIAAHKALASGGRAAASGQCGITRS
ncbi:MAG: glycerophosphodiester phosphodiesterase family protein [Parvularculaceae bacterium]|nr:glycerophosphodiester phosphodiesterase family protein [Parvularculaceae bacterium]